MSFRAYKKKSKSLKKFIQRKIGYQLNTSYLYKKIALFVSFSNALHLFRDLTKLDFLEKQSWKGDTTPRKGCWVVGTIKI